MTSKLKTLVKPKDINVDSPSDIVISPSVSTKYSKYQALQVLKEQLPSVVIKVIFARFFFNKKNKRLKLFALFLRVCLQ